MMGNRSSEGSFSPAGYRPRADYSDVPPDSHDQWTTQHGVQRRSPDILRDNEGTTAGLAAVRLSPCSQDVGQRLARREPRLSYLGRVQDTGEGRQYHGMVADLKAHEAPHEWWSQALTCRSAGGHGKTDRVHPTSLTA